MSPRIVSKDFIRRNHLDISMKQEGSVHHPIHILIHETDSNDIIRVLMYTDNDDIQFVYSDDLPANKKQAFEQWAIRNVEAIKHNWDLITNNASGSFIIGLE